MRFTCFALVLCAVSLSTACNEEDNGLGIGQSGDSYRATLAGGNVRPVGVTSGASGTATVTVREPSIGSSVRTVGFTITVAGLSRATAAHLHLGGPAVSNGQILATLFTNPSDTAITAAQLAAGSIAEGSISIGLDSLVSLLRSGHAYVDVHSTANPEGILRGQLLRPGDDPPTERFAAPTLTGANERPVPVITNATGSARFEVAGATSISFTITVTGLTGATQAHIHHAVPDSAGPILVGLFSATTPTGPLTGTLATGTITSASIQGGVSLDSLLTLMRLGRTYVNVHTVANEAGEIRGQIVPVTVLP